MPETEIVRAKIVQVDPLLIHIIPVKGKKGDVVPAVWRTGTDLTFPVGVNQLVKAEHKAYGWIVLGLFVDPKRQKAGSKARRVGNLGEREAAKIICVAAGLTPWRDHLPTSRDVVGGNQQVRAGDIIPFSPEALAMFGSFGTIQVKARKSLTPSGLLDARGLVRNNKTLKGWLDRSVADAGDKPPLVIVKLASIGYFAFVPAGAFDMLPVQRATVDANTLMNFRDEEGVPWGVLDLAALAVILRSLVPTHEETSDAADRVEGEKLSQLQNA